MNTMRFKVYSPTAVILEADVSKVEAEGIDGFFTLLPRHTDFISALKQSILSYTKSDGAVSYIACDKGVLVKKGEAVSLSTKLAILDDDLKHLEYLIETDFKAMEQQRKEVNLTMARLEVGLAKGLNTLKNGGENVGI